MAAAQDLYLQLRISEFCERCCVWKISDRHLRTISTPNKSTRSWCPPQSPEISNSMYEPHEFEGAGCGTRAPNQNESSLKVNIGPTPPRPARVAHPPPPPQPASALAGPSHIRSQWPGWAAVPSHKPPVLSHAARARALGSAAAEPST